MYPYLIIFYQRKFYQELIKSIKIYDKIKNLSLTTMLIDNFFLNTAFILIGAYLIGAFPSAYIAGRLRGINILRSGTRNVGGMNTVASVGIVYGVIVAAVDIGKGFLVAFLAGLFSGGHPFIPLWAVAAAVIGHNWMIYIGFKGGKGVATLIGGLLFLSPWSILFLFLTFHPYNICPSKRQLSGNGFRVFPFRFFPVGLGRQYMVACIRPYYYSTLFHKMHIALKGVLYRKAKGYTSSTEKDLQIPF